MSIQTHAAYAAALFAVEFPDATVTLRVGPPPDDLPLSMASRRLSVVTAFNPRDERPTLVANRGANELLRAALRDAGWSFLPAVGRSAAGDHAEPSFALLDIDEERARELGSRFEQACVFYWVRADIALV